MRLKLTSYKELQEIYLTEFGTELSDQDALELGEWLIDVVLAIKG